MEDIQKKNREIDLFNFTNFFHLDFLKLSDPLWKASIIFRGSG